MDYKFLDKVLDQLVYETRIDYDMGEIQFPFSSFSPFPSSPSSSPFFSSSFFSDHCEDVYGLNDDEIKYVWEEYVQIIKDKINSNG